MGILVQPIEILEIYVDSRSIYEKYYGNKKVILKMLNNEIKVLNRKVKSIVFWKTLLLSTHDTECNTY